MNITTTKLEEFGYRETYLAGKLLIAVGDAKFESAEDKKAYEDGSNIELMMNKDSGYVFLATDEGDTLMMNENLKVERFIVCQGDCGTEGFHREFNEEGLCNKCGLKLGRYGNHEEKEAK